MMDLCPICGKRIIRTKGNWVIVDGQLIHKKCPNVVKTIESTQVDYKELTEAIHGYLLQCPKGYIVESGMSWRRTTKLIKELKLEGYSYKDQLYVLHEVVKLQDGFFGYGAVVNNIRTIMERKNREEELQNKPKAERHVAFNLSKLINGEYDD